MNPYLVLGLPAEADDQTIRRAYLQAIKESPPDADPKRFQAVSQAYEKIKDQTSRHRHILFNSQSPADSPLDALARYAHYHRQFEPLGFEAMKKLLTAAARTDVK
jgi:curved DNA-binding protein CbpA